MMIVSAMSFGCRAMERPRDLQQNFLCFSHEKDKEEETWSNSKTTRALPSNWTHNKERHNIFRGRLTFEASVGVQTMFLGREVRSEEG